MATIKFYPYLSKGKSKVYIRLTIKRGKDFRLSTGLQIKDSRTWNYETNYPKKNSADNKNLYNALQELENHLDTTISNIEKSRTESIDDLTSQRIKSIILDFFNEAPITDKDLLVPYAYQYADGLINKTYQRHGNRISYKENTIEKYKNFAKNLEEYETKLGRQIKIKDVNDDFTESFLSFLTDKRKLAVNTKGRYLKRLKTIIKDAEINGIKVDPKYKLIKGFEDETVVTFLTFEEIDQMIDTEMPSDKLQIAKDWLIIGCYTGQRISDLYRMNKEMLITQNGHDFISLKQFKTGKKVMIPIHYKVERILKKYNNNFPPNFHENEKSNRTELSGLMKDVCRIAGITKIERGRYNGVIGDYPKYKLIQNHSCRRSFASNFYGLNGWTTPMIMEITGHVTEKNFLKYIDKDNFYLSEQAARNFAEMKKADEQEKKKLRVLK